jgi:hypothetical protein
MTSKSGSVERRGRKRYTVDWLIMVNGRQPEGTFFTETGRLRDLSSNGAFGYVANPLKVGTRLDVLILPPSLSRKWMKLPAEVIRVEITPRGIGAAFKYMSSWPEFV